MKTFSQNTFQKDFQQMNSQMLQQQRAALRQSTQQVQGWQANMQAAFQQVSLSARQNASDMQRNYSNTFKGLERMMTDFVLKGKVDFRALVSSILKDLLRLQQKRNFSNASSGLGSLFGTLTAGLFHTGGVVGEGGGTVRGVSSEIFATAPRLHSGGIAGDEVPTILQRGEGVFTQAQMKALRPANDHDRSAMQNVVVNIHNAPAGTRVQQSRSAGGNLQIDVLVEQIEGQIAANTARGDGLAPMLEHTYAMQRVGQ